ncbi:ParB/RepB/Spo0J family partition protein [Falsirhodobacter algicola]|uniref:ParB/RepB/Spo0J family partition protein n=1 Tax=Falsirhodobacter algicola TaxID=2692330 RepID=A0A8J8MV04_9RHOB|nr:ParB/RepB/Spo0J family partition protein [Falsirhodobacter algicola]QUS37216.1 ParB/RepB/Spo0J family partition protein [Falsirhodobacter algicola]
MSKRHDAIDDILKGFDTAAPTVEDRGGARFLKRSNALSDSGEREEKTLRWVDPAQCVMWERHNREYALLTEQNCADLITSIRAQGRQEFPAIVRRKGEGYEVICGARRHFAISWLRAHNYPQFRYLVDVRDLTDEEAFRLADIENRDREDISDYERARDYAQALEAYYGGRQKAMAERLEVSEGWLSRYLQLARLPQEIIAAYANLREVKELHARTLRPLLSDPRTRDQVLAAAAELAAEQAGQGGPVPAAQVLARLKAAATGPKKARPPANLFRRNIHESGVAMYRKNGKVTLEFAESLSDEALRAAFDQFLEARRG